MVPKIYDVKIYDSYTCQFCHKDFRSTTTLKIYPGYLPVCSKRCEFRLIYNTIARQGYSDETLQEMQGTLQINQQEGGFNRLNALFAISKYYAKIGLSNIIIIGTRDRDMKTGTNTPVPKIGTKKGTTTPLIGGCPFVPILEGGSVLSQELKEWF